MARALAEEVHLDERYVAERLRDAVAGMYVYMHGFGLRGTLVWGVLLTSTSDAT